LARYMKAAIAARSCKFAATRITWPSVPDKIVYRRLKSVNATSTDAT
jgi:hypothetical protein